MAGMARRFENVEMFKNEPLRMSLIQHQVFSLLYATHETVRKEIVLGLLSQSINFCRDSHSLPCKSLWDPPMITTTSVFDYKIYKKLYVCVTFLRI